MVAWGIISIYTGGVMKEFVKSAIFQPFWGHFHMVKLIQHKCQNQLANSNIKHPKPKYLLFLGVTHNHICLKEFEFPFSPKSGSLYCTHLYYTSRPTTIYQFSTPAPSELAAGSSDQSLCENAGDSGVGSPHRIYICFSLPY